MSESYIFLWLELGTYLIHLSRGNITATMLEKNFSALRLKKIDGIKISFIDAVFRELVIKSILNVLLGELINIGSFICACFSDEQNTLHDKAAKIRVFSVKG